jgi:hypothetical protein
MSRVSILEDMRRLGNVVGKRSGGRMERVSNRRTASDAEIQHQTSSEHLRKDGCQQIICDIYG